MEAERQTGDYTAHWAAFPHPEKNSTSSIDFHLNEPDVIIHTRVGKTRREIDFEKKQEALSLSE